MIIREWSDTVVVATLYLSEWWTTTDVNSAEYDSILMEMKFADWTFLEKNWTVENDNTVSFVLSSDDTKNKQGQAEIDIRWIQDDKRTRFNLEKIKVEVSDSVKIPNLSE
jgi:hypothetical protein